ncbi:MAG TPA: hypothetical protein VGQ09_23905 [Chitinophagaceae bacterium]|nr:hypothetical protein [Chitinophagaceae bacterium]
MKIRNSFIIFRPHASPPNSLRNPTRAEKKSVSSSFKPPPNAIIFHPPAECGHKSTTNLPGS